MQLYLNGECRHFKQVLSIAELCQELGIVQQRYAVEVNRQIVPKSLHAQHQLNPDDRVEIIQAMGGG